MKVVIDSREQAPFTFNHERYGVEVVRGALRSPCMGDSYPRWSAPVPRWARRSSLPLPASLPSSMMEKAAYWQAP